MSALPSRPTAGLDWEAMADALDEEGFAITPPVLSAAECRQLRARFDDESTRFRSMVDMERHNYGRGRYRYFDDPLPTEVQALRNAFYPSLAKVANEWARRLGQEPSWPATLAELTAHCHANGQTRPTPLLLRYGPGDYNRLHQDVYGPIHFPLQVIVLLSEPGDEFTGGELILVEQRPRMQSRPIVVPLGLGTAAIITGRDRPRPGVRGFHRVQMRHGVARVQSGTRMTLGLIFHDAR